MRLLAELTCWNRFFFQAEDGIRDLTVTGVQTCALPISAGQRHRPRLARRCGPERRKEERVHPLLRPAPLRARGQLDQQCRVEGPRSEIEADGTAQLER